MTPEDLREQFNKEGKYPTMTYGMWLEEKLIEAEQRERTAFESGVMIGWLNDSVREKDLETFKSVKYHEYLQSRKEKE